MIPVAVGGGSAENGRIKELWKPLPVEIVRRRVIRAAWLGLSYRRYAIILLGGSDVEGIHFTGRMVIAREGEAAGRDHIGDKLAAVSGRKRLLLASRKDTRFFVAANPERQTLFDALVSVSSLEPPTHPAPRPDREALGAALQKQALPSRMVALVGNGSSGPIWIAAARLAGFVADNEYFAK